MKCYYCNMDIKDKYLLVGGLDHSNKEYAVHFDNCISEIWEIIPDTSVLSVRKI